MNHVPFKGAAPLVQDLLGGHLDLAFTPMAGSVPGLIESKKLKFYGMTTAARSEKLKHLATVNEGRVLRNFIYSIWVGPVVPRPTPEDTAQRIHAALNDAMKEPEVRKTVESAGFVEMAPLSLAGADRMFQAEVAKFRKIAQMIKLEPQ